MPCAFADLAADLPAITVQPDAAISQSLPGLPEPVCMPQGSKHGASQHRPGPTGSLPDDSAAGGSTQGHYCKSSWTWTAQKLTATVVGAVERLAAACARRCS